MHNKYLHVTHTYTSTYNHRIWAMWAQTGRKLFVTREQKLFGRSHDMFTKKRNRPRFWA